MFIIMKHYYLSFFIATLMSMAYTMASAHDIAVANSDGKTIYYNYSSDGTSVSVTYQGTSFSSYSNEYTGDVVIPETVTYGGKTYIVTSIGDFAFEDCSSLTSVSIPNSVTRIGNATFANCTGLTSATIPNSVKRIEMGAFMDCTTLKSIDLPNSLRDIMRYAFSNTGLTSIVIPSSVEYIDDNIFSDSESLKSITFEGPVDFFVNFFEKSDLTEINIPDTFPGVKAGMFDETAWYNNQPDGVVYLGKIAYKYKGTMPENTTLTLKEGTIGVAGGAFEDCTGLTNIVIPNSVIDIGPGAFDGTTWYHNQPDGLVYVGNVAYKYKGTMPDNTSLTLREGTVGIGDEAFYDCKGLIDINLPNSIVNMGRNPFYGCENLTSIEIPNSVKRIGYEVFGGGIKNITIPKSVTYISDYAFSYTHENIIVQAETPPTMSYDGTFNDTNATLYVPAKAIETYRTTSPWSNFTNIQAIEGTDTVCGICGENLTWIYDKPTKTMTISGTGEMTDYVGCNDVPWNEIIDSIKVVNINEGVISIGDYAFFNCNNMVSISIPNTIERIGTGAFANCSKLSGIELPEKLSSIERLTFWRCDSLKSILIPDNITTIKEYAFVGCSSLKSIEIGKSVKNIENYAFGRNGSFTLKLSNCTLTSGVCPVSKSLNKIVWRAKEYRASCNAFALYSNQITDFQFGDEVTVIPPGLCNGMSNLRTISIPSSVVNIGSMAFYGCTGLKSVLIPDGVAYIGDSAFGNCRRLASVNIPSTLTEIEPGTFNGCINLSAINIPNNVTSIGDAAFAECDSLVSVVVPSSVTNVGSYAFGGCSQLRLLQFVSTMPIQLTAEIGITSQTKYVVPEESLDDYKKAWLEYYRPDVYTYLPIPLDGVMFTEKATLDNYAAAMQDIDKSTITSVCFYDNIDANLTVEKIQEGMNPNCLYYYYSDNALQGKNLVNLDGYSCEKIILSDANVFRCLIPFTAKKAQFTHTPSIWANGFGGWETLCLPFEVSAFKASESGYISPILLGAYGDFWLRQFVGASSKTLYFSSTLDGTMKANTPYLLAFPGSVMGSGHLQGQTISFLGKNVEFASDATAEVQRNDKVFVGNYDNVADDASGWILNSTGSDLIASSVVGDKPFRAYFRTEDDFADFNAAKALNISFVEDEETAIREIDEDRNAENELNIYSIDGTLIRKAENNSDSVNGLKKGAYIINRKKVMIR